MKTEALKDYDDLLAGHVVLRSWYPDAAARPQTPVAAPVTAFPHSHGRYSDRPLDWGARLFGLGGTAALALAIPLCLFVTWRLAYPAHMPAEPLVVTMEALAAPPEPVEEVPEGPRQVEQQDRKVEREERPEPPKVLIPQLTPSPTPLEPPAPAAKPADPVPETTAPKALLAPPARRASSNADASWEALLLAHLEKYRRYPAAARSRREEGVAFVTFRMNRGGKVLSASLARSSGSIFLDRAALETIRRAQPLPAIPADKPDELELSVPVEFFLH
nr:energy transducer TonB [Novosphingobium panipatense]